MKKKVLIVSGINWNSAYQRHQLNATLLANSGYEVDFLQDCSTSKPSLENIKRRVLAKVFSRNLSVHENQCPSNVNLISCKFLPPYGFISKLINRMIFKYYLTKKISNSYELAIVYTPSDHVMFLNELTKGRIIYDCVRAFSNWGGYHDSLYKNEEKLLSISKAVICDSFYLQQVHINEINPNVRVIQILPPIEAMVIDRKPIPTKIKRIGYFGSISDHIDIKAFEVLLQFGCEVCFWGVDNENLLPESVLNFGYVSDQSQLMKDISDNCDALIIPYNKPLNGVYPAKLAISLMSGLPIFCSRFYDALELKDMLYIYDDLDCLIKMIHQYSLEEHRVKYTKSLDFIELLAMDRYKHRFFEVISESK